MNFHKRLRKMQADNDLTFKAIAEACGVSYQTVQQWASDDGTYPKIDNLESLAGILKTTPWFLLFGVHAAGESPMKGQSPSLSDEAEELIQCVIRLDRAEKRVRKIFSATQGLLLLALEGIKSEDAQAGLDLATQPTTRDLLAAAEGEAQDVLSRGVHTREGENAGPKHGGRRS